MFLRKGEGEERKAPRYASAAASCDDHMTTCNIIPNSYSYTHYKSSLVKVIGILIKYAIRLTRLLHKLKPRAYYLWILTFRALRVEFIIPLCLKLWLSVNKSRYLVLANWLWGRILATRSE